MLKSKYTQMHAAKYALKPKKDPNFQKLQFISERGFARMMTFSSV